MIARHAFPNSSDDVSEHFDPYRAARMIKGPLSFRLALGLSQADMGRRLGRFTGKKAYTRSTLCDWERIERGQRQPLKYRMTDRAREAYRQILSELVEHSAGGRLSLRAHMGVRVWRFELWATCKCGRAFRLRRARQVRCAVCLRFR